MQTKGYKKGKGVQIACLKFKVFKQKYLPPKNIYLKKHNNTLYFQ